MSYLANIFSHILTNKDDISAFFRKGSVMKGVRNTRDNVSSIVVRHSFPLPSPTRPLCSIHISSMVSFVSNIIFPFYIEKNIKHHDAEEETFNHSRCLGLGERNGIRLRKTTRVFTFTIVCKGTSHCVSSPCGPTSKRMRCGYGIRFYTLNARPDTVIVEQFGVHNDELGVNDMGHLLIPENMRERRSMTVGDEVEALLSLIRGLTPAKHLAYCAELRTLNYAIPNANVTLPSIQNAFRRFKRVTHATQDISGVHNLTNYFQKKQDKFYFSSVNIENYSDQEPMVILLAMKEICHQVPDFGFDILGLDATWGVTAYDFALFAIMGRCKGGALPLAYFIASSKSALAVSIGLTKFKKAMNEILFSRMETTYGSDYALENFVSYSPLGFCIDKDDAEHLAISTIFPEAAVVLCHYHAMVIFVNEVRAERHSLGKEGVVQMMNMLRKLCASSTIDEFTHSLSDIRLLSSSFYEYLSKNFLNSRWVDTFSEVNRQHLSSSVLRLCRSNMLVEVSFKTLKYVIFGGFHNKRLDDLLYTLAFRVFPYFVSRQGGTSTYKPRFHTSKCALEEGTLLYRFAQYYCGVIIEKTVSSFFTNII